MNGTIKFYNQEKGYGFIYTHEHDKDIYFRISEWKNPSSPNPDDDVNFETETSKKGLIATNIKCIKSAKFKKETHNPNLNMRDDRISCSNCGKKIVPRLITYQGNPEKSVCPFCGTTIKHFGINPVHYLIMITIGIFLIFIVLLN